MPPVVVVTRRAPQQAFTIVELLIVIVVIGILAAITIVAYSGIQNRARAAALQSDSLQAAKQLKLFQAESGKYPATVSTDCTASPDSTTNKCLKLSGGNTIKSYSSPSPNDTFNLTIADAGNTLSSTVTDSTNPSVVSGGGGAFDGVTVGSQTWATANLNVGTMIPGGTAQTNNGTIEKYCYNNDEANCSTYGALYQWDEAMKYSTTEGAQGICPAGSHIPTDDEWKTLEMSLGMTQAQADTTGFRGTDQGTQLKPSGSSGLNIPLAGFHSSAGPFSYLGTLGNEWSSSESGGGAWSRYLESGSATVRRIAYDKANGLSVRCLEN